MIPSMHAVPDNDGHHVLISSSVACHCHVHEMSVAVYHCWLMQHLDLELSEGFEMCLSSGDELSGLSRLRSLTLSGGKFTSEAVERLLQALALACPQLEQLRVLPQATCGLGDNQVSLMCQLQSLKVSFNMAFAGHLPCRFTYSHLCSCGQYKHLQGCMSCGVHYCAAPEL